LRDLDLISSHPQLGKLFLTQIILSSPDDLKSDELIEEFHIPSRKPDLLHSELEEKGDGESKKQHLISDHLKRRKRRRSNFLKKPKTKKMLLQKVERRIQIRLTIIQMKKRKLDQLPFHHQRIIRYIMRSKRTRVFGSL